MSLNIVWLGELGFPYGLASIQKAILVGKALYLCGINLTVINRFGIHDEDAGLEINKEGIYESVNYVYASGCPYRPRNIIIRNAFKIYGLINEILLLHKLHNNGKLDAAILRTDKFLSILFYRIISKLFGFPLVMLYVELYSSIVSRTGIKYKLNDYLYEKLGFYLVDGIMPISNYLIDIVKRHSPKLPVMKVPMITDFDRFNGVKMNKEKKYFLFCGGAGYFEIIAFVLKAFQCIKSSDNVCLYLIVNGRPTQMKNVENEIAKNQKRNAIKLFSGISNNHLTELYKGAAGLLIPMRQTIQDMARFPHKLGEYLASGNPVITTNFGEVAEYFKDEESALISPDYNVNEFAKKMEYILLHPDKSKEIGNNGRLVGLEQFDYKIFGPKIREFIKSVIARTL